MFFRMIFCQSPSLWCGFGRSSREIEFRLRLDQFSERAEIDLFSLRSFDFSWKSSLMLRTKVTFRAYSFSRSCSQR